MKYINLLCFALLIAGNVLAKEERHECFVVRPNGTFTARFNAYLVNDSYYSFSFEGYVDEIAGLLRSHEFLPKTHEVFASQFYFAKADCHWMTPLHLFCGHELKEDEKHFFARYRDKENRIHEYNFSVGTTSIPWEVHVRYDLEQSTWSWTLAKPHTAAPMHTVKLENCGKRTIN